MTSGKQAHLDTECSFCAHAGVAVRDLMFANILAGPTVEQQGEMARSGGRMLATLEPEQVITLANSSVGFQGKSCCEV